MTQINQEYRCSVCGNIVKVIQAGAGSLVCCGEDMEMIDSGIKEEVPEQL